MTGALYDWLFAANSCTMLPSFSLLSAPLSASDGRRPTLTTVAGMYVDLKQGAGVSAGFIFAQLLPPSLVDIGQKKRLRDPVDGRY